MNHPVGVRVRVREGFPGAGLVGTVQRHDTDAYGAPVLKIYMAWHNSNHHRTYTYRPHEVEPYAIKV